MCDCVCLCVWFRRVGGGRLDGLLTQSPHTPVAGCTTTFSFGGRMRFLVLDSSSHDFVALIWMWELGNDSGEADRQAARHISAVFSLAHCLQ